MNWLKRRIPLILITLLLVLGSRYGMDIADTIRLANYQPPQEIATLAQKTTMTDLGRRLFYINQPQIEDQKQYLNVCKSSEATVVLGCYIPAKGIFIQRIDDSRLAGVMEVTAAHEMLHVAYDRLSIAERQEIDRELQTAYDKMKDERVRKLIESYRRRDAKVVKTEMHSILGTEIEQLTPKLERHYRKYFDRRSQIVAFSNQYEGVFASLRQRAQALELQLKTLKASIGQSQDQLERDAQSVKTERQEIQNQQQVNPNLDYNSRISSFNFRLANLKQLDHFVESQIDRYNLLVREYNSLALQEKSLVESLEHNRE
jgi:hypothetical protein